MSGRLHLIDATALNAILYYYFKPYIFPKSTGIFKFIFFNKKPPLKKIKGGFAF